MLAQKSETLVIVLGITHSGNGVCRTELASEVAGKHIYLVGVSNADKEVGVGRTCFFKRVEVNGISADSHHIVNVRRFVKDVGVLVDHEDVMPLGGKTVYHGFTDFSATNDNDLHIFLQSSAEKCRNTIRIYKIIISQSKKNCNRK